MQNQFENHQLVMHNDPSDCFKSLTFLKENNISHSILQFNSALFAEFIVQLVQGFEKYLLYLLIEVIMLMPKTSITHLITVHKPDLVLGDFDIMH